MFESESILTWMPAGWPVIVQVVETVDVVELVTKAIVEVFGVWFELLCEFPFVVSVSVQEVPEYLIGTITFDPPTVTFPESGVKNPAEGLTIYE